MTQRLKPKQVWITGAIASIALGGGLFGLNVATQAQSSADQDQNTALQAVAKMTEAQLVRGTDLANPTKLALQCGDFSVQVPASKVTE